MSNGRLHLSGRRSLVVAGIALAMFGALLYLGIPAIRGGGVAGAAPPALAATFPALNGGARTGLTIVRHTPGAPAAPSDGPTFPATRPAGVAEDWPEAQSIRDLPVVLGAASAWIARSDDGGICVLLARNRPVRPGVYGIAASCSPPAAASKGATVELEDASGPGVAIAGVVPAGVTNVVVELADGTTRSIAVRDGAWALEAGSAVRHVNDATGG